MESVDQRALNLLAVKVGDFKKKSALRPIRSKCVQASSAQVRLRLGSHQSQTLTDGNFAAL